MLPKQSSSSNLPVAREPHKQPPAPKRDHHTATILPHIDYSSLPSTITLNGHSSYVGSVAFSPSDQFIASGSGDKTVRLWDAHLGTHIADLTGHRSDIWSVAFSPDGTILASGSYDPSIKLWDVRSQVEIATLESASSVRCVAFSPNGLQLAAGLYDSTTLVYDVESRACTNVLKGHRNSHWVTCVEFSPDSKRIVSSSSDHTVRIWDVVSGDCISVLEGHSDLVRAATFSPDGQLLATGSEDRTIRLWNAATGAHITTLQGHLNRVYSVAFSPDGKYIASASYDKTLRLWDVSSRSHISTLNGHTENVWFVAFSPDGSRLVSASDDETVRLWNFRKNGSGSVDERLDRSVQDTPYSESTSPLTSGSLDHEITSLASMIASSEISSEQSPPEPSTISPGVQVRNPVSATNLEEPSPLSPSIALSNDISSQVTLENYEQIGLGGFGGVFLGNHNNRGKVAMKKPHKLFDDTEARRFLREVNLWCSVSSRFVLPCLGMCKIGPHVYVVSPFIENGDLMSCISRGVDLNRSKLLYEIADALTYLHYKGIVHGDVKAQNVLISDDGSALLCDFGLAKAYDTMKTSTEAKGTGSIRWMAPELFENASRSMATDVYSYGVTIAEVLSGQTPFSEMTDNVAVLCYVLLRNGRPAKSPAHSPSGKSYSVLWDTAEKCWAKEAGSRPNMAQVLGMLFTLARETN